MARLATIILGTTLFLAGSVGACGSDENTGGSPNNPEGGLSESGDASGFGGATKGGSAGKSSGGNGGSSVGGSSTGGSSTGGSSTGGSSTGGSSAGGSSTGGSSTGGSSTGGSSAGGSSTGGSSTGGSSTGGSGLGGSSVGGSGPAGSGGAAGCLGATLLSQLGGDTLLIGGALEDATAASAPFDVRYQYLAGGLFDSPTPCTSCLTNCTSGGTSCSNAVGCGWWGCWQWDQQPPGLFATDFVDKNEAAQWQGASRPQIPWFTYYEELHASGLQEGTPQVAAINNAAFLTRYFADWRFLLQKIGTHVALLHIEPDFWGYVEQLNSNPHAVPAAVTAANPTDCAGYENSAAGFSRCLIHMVRVYAPNARVGLHASAWGTMFDVFGNSDPGLNVLGEAQKLSSFFLELGAGESDFIVADPSDRDAGYYESIGQDTWWDDTNATIPSFQQALTWSKAVAEHLNLPLILWQIPVGNVGLNNSTDHWKDNRVDYFFGHLDELVNAHVVGLLFGAGMSGMTTPETDGGNLVNKTIAYRASGGTKVCP